MLTTFGDGATSEGEWHESVNFAAVHRLPIVFLCENNEWAISTPLSQQMAPARRLQARGRLWHSRSRRRTAWIPIACYAVVKEALDRARSGGGPTLVEAKCYRFLSHTTDDDDRTYRSREEVEERRKDDPVPGFERLLIEHGDPHREERGSIEAFRARRSQRRDRPRRGDGLSGGGDLYERVYAEGWQPWRE